MKPCLHESALKQTIQRGQWPHAADPDLRTHVITCGTCAAAAHMSQLFQTARTATMQRAPLAAPGVIWFRAQLRRRNAALETIARPIRTAQIFAAIICLLATVGFVVFTQRTGPATWLSDLERLAAHPGQLWTLATTATGWSPALFVSTVSALILFAGVALFLASDFGKPSRN